ncbi:MAG TPA: ABC transporter permease, partial [Casimicrobium sp.]|nr:ABC transporter permease [Casimicrobium sp.]
MSKSSPVSAAEFNPSPLALGPGFRALFYKECLRFWKVAFQTVVAPVVTTLLYLLIFSHVLESNVKVYDGRVGYTAFLIPGLVMMAVLQNAFANSSSSLIQSKMMRSVIFILLPPITSFEIFCAYVGGAMVRGLCVGLGIARRVDYLVRRKAQPREVLHVALHADHERPALYLELREVVHHVVNDEHETTAAALSNGVVKRCDPRVAEVHVGVWRGPETGVDDC